MFWNSTTPQLSTACELDPAAIHFKQDFLPIIIRIILVIIIRIRLTSADPKAHRKYFRHPASTGRDRFLQLQRSCAISRHSLHVPLDTNGICPPSNHIQFFTQLFSSCRSTPKPSSSLYLVLNMFNASRVQLRFLSFKDTPRDHHPLGT